MFGVHLSFHVFEEPRDPKPTLQELAKVAKLVRLEMFLRMALLRVICALHYKVPPAADTAHQVKDTWFWSFWRNRCTIKLVNGLELTS